MPHQKHTDEHRTHLNSIEHSLHPPPKKNNKIKAYDSQETLVGE